MNWSYFTVDDWDGFTLAAWDGFLLDPATGDHLAAASIYRPGAVAAVIYGQVEAGGINL